MTSAARIRIVTATSLFDGHDAAINIMRRILQASGAEVIHLGHDRSAADIAEAAIEEDAHAVAVTSYQGGHMEFFRYLRALLDEGGGEDIVIFGGGGGTILPEEGAELLAEGTARIYSPDDGRTLGLQGMIDDLLAAATHPQPVLGSDMVDRVLKADHAAMARAITLAENAPQGSVSVLSAIREHAERSRAPVVGFTGTGGSGKSSILDELVLRFRRDHPERSIAVISVDPSRRRSGGALLGDRIRMNSVSGDDVFMRSLATRQANLSMSPFVAEAVSVAKAAGFDLILLETSGIGQSDTEIIDASDVSVYVMTPEFGAAMQLEKIDMLDFADVIAINKSDRRGAEDALRDVRKQVRRNRTEFDLPDEDLPVVATIASSFNDAGTQELYERIMDAVLTKAPDTFQPVPHRRGRDAIEPVIPRSRVRYLSEITDTIRAYNAETETMATAAGDLQALERVAELAQDVDIGDRIAAATAQLLPDLLGDLSRWDEEAERYSGASISYEVRGKTITVDNTVESLSGTTFPRVIHPSLEGWPDRIRWLRKENVPGRFPFTAGVFPFKRQAEDPTRMFAGEGGPEQTNGRFHYVAAGVPFTRLSTAFDSVTLYGNDPDRRPDIYGKVGNSGVSVSTLDDAKKLYSGFDLADPTTSVSMTINGPAPMMLAFFLNTAIDQVCERYIVENGLTDEVETAIATRYEQSGALRPRYRAPLPPGHDGSGLMLLGVTGADVLPREVYDKIKAETIASVRGTIQADILKEDQAQNTCIFSTEFALSMQGDIQEYFVEHGVRNFYSVSISGYHMAEAGANPITQLAFTLANGFTFVEYFLSRGMRIDDFAPNLSFFFSNGLDPEYAVIGRVARRIWAKAMRDLYGASERSQKLKYHIQTSGRSLHAQEIEFNDIRTTLQALYAIYDNCNSLHTNAYNEAITTPTEDSVRRALAIQLIINKELGLARSENPLQGSTIVEELTDLVEEAVLTEFDRLTDRGGVLGAMETMYQRSKIQEESLRYERRKDSGELEIIGVNTFLSKDGSPFVRPHEVIRSTDEDKEQLIGDLRSLHERDPDAAARAIAGLQEVALRGGNIFEELLEASKLCSLGQLSQALFEVGGRYRRNM
ncbi:MAG: methylmalonyl-CoA mutase family protein [Acidimicrobiia bacterium]|nr:MAG: methylmalonyl-CoA mutase family protein [Acidimicrobiia bacterium]